MKKVLIFFSISLLILISLLIFYPHNNEVIIMNHSPPLAPESPSDTGNYITIFLGGDVMTGRGIDQILPHPSDPVIHEPYMRSALGYVRIAEQANGPIAQTYRRETVGFATSPHR